MDPETATQWLDLLVRLGIGFTAACVLFIWALWKGKLHWHWEVEAARKREEEWKALAYRLTDWGKAVVEDKERRLP